MVVDHGGMACVITSNNLRSNIIIFIINHMTSNDHDDKEGVHGHDDDNIDRRIYMITISFLIEIYMFLIEIYMLLLNKSIPFEMFITIRWMEK